MADNQIPVVQTTVNVQDTLPQVPFIPSNVPATLPVPPQNPLNMLPIRGEKRVIPSFDSLNVAAAAVMAGAGANGTSPSKSKNPVQPSDFFISAAKKAFKDYISIRLQHRGYKNGKPDTTSPALFRFLITPESAQVTKTTLDAQAFTRAGWQFGLWGEDVTQITMNGTTPGQYFSLGLTDEFALFTQSYRNFQQLQMVFENNGYWFEGEEAGSGPLAAGFTRRRIKTHADVELTVGNFIWHGMFESLAVTQNGDTPFGVSFNLTFIAWKERYRSNSPYWDSIHNDTQRGHSYKNFTTSPMSSTSKDLHDQIAKAPPVIQQESAALLGDMLVSPAEVAAQADDSRPTVSSDVMDTTPMDRVFFPRNYHW